ncbi:MAG: ABC transporter permease [Methanoculleaceae archaeon]
MNPEEPLEQLRRALAITGKDIRVYYAKGPVVIFGLIMPLFLFLAFAVGNRGVGAPFLIAGLMAMTLFFTSTAVSPVIPPWEALGRTLERLLASPITVRALIVGDLLASLIFSLIISAVPVAIACAIGIPPLHPFILIAGIFTGAVCFSAFGLILPAVSANTPSNVMMLSSLVKFPIIFISGVFIPLEELPFWGFVLAACSPLTYFTDIARYAMEGTHTFPVVLDLLVLAGFAVLFCTLAVNLHERTIHRRV